MKNIIAMIMAVLFLICTTAICTFAVPSAAENIDTAQERATDETGFLADISGKCGDSLSWNLDENGVLSISGTGGMYNWDSVENTPWYSVIDKITGIVVDEGVTSIGKNAFDIMTDGNIDADFGDLIYEVVDEGQIGNITWQIGDNGALHLLGDGVLSDFASENDVPWKAFRKDITHVLIADTITGIGDYAFYGMTGVEKMSLPNSVTSLGDNVFSDCTALTEVYLGSVSSVSANVFAGCTAFEKLKAGNYDCYLGIKKSLGENIGFELLIGENKKVIDLELPKSVATIGYGAFDRFFCVVSGYKNTCAEQFAESYGYPFFFRGVLIDIGEKLSEKNIRYAETDGFQYEIEEDNNTYYVYPEKDMLVEIVEKESADSIYAVSTKYYYVDSETLEYTELYDLGSYMGNVKDATIRTKEPVSVRYTSQITNKAKREEIDFVVKEYGFIVGVKSLLEQNETQLNFDFKQYATGVAYNKDLGIDLVFDSSDDDLCIFTGILINVPKKNYSTVVTSKTYAKIKIFDNEFVVYGEPVDTSMYDTAKKLVGSDDIAPEQNAVLKEIIRIVEQNESGIPSDGLFS